MDCLFVSQPKECNICLETGKLQCLLNKRHLIVRPEAKSELVKLLLATIDHPDRYKTKSGEAGRKHFTS